MRLFKEPMLLQKGIMSIHSFQVDGVQVTHYTPTVKNFLVPLLFIHGMWGHSNQFGRWIDQALRMGYEVYAVTLRGHKPQIAQNAEIKKTNTKSHVRDILAIIGQIGRRVTVVGHSYGGLLSQKVASMSNLYALVLVGSVPPAWILLQGKILWRMNFYLPEMLLGLKIRFSARDQRDFFYNRPCRDEGLVSDSGRVAFDIAFMRVGVKAADIKCPVLVVAGKYDTLMTLPVQKKIAAKYRADLQVVEAGHMIPLEDNGPVFEGIHSWIVEKANVFDFDTAAWTNRTETVGTLRAKTA